MLFASPLSLYKELHMYRIVKRKELNPTVTLLEIEAPLVAKKAKPGQFIILRTDAAGERIPLTIADSNKETGTVTIIFQIVGGTTESLNHLKEGESLEDFVGPLGRATEIEGLKKVAVVGGGVGSAIAYPVAKALHEAGAEVHAIVGFRNKDLVILEDEFRLNSSRFVLMSDDGSAGEKGLVTDQIVVTIGYDIENLTDPERRKKYHGDIVKDHYGRQIPKHSHGTQNLGRHTSSTKLILDATSELFDRIAYRDLLIRRLNITANHVIDEASAPKQESQFEQLDFFTDYAAREAEQKKEEAERERERKMQRAVLTIRKKYGKNAILKGMNLEEGATAKDRNEQIGGHKA